MWALQGKGSTFLRLESYAFLMFPLRFVGWENFIEGGSAIFGYRSYE